MFNMIENKFNKEASKREELNIDGQDPIIFDIGP